MKKTKFRIVSKCFQTSQACGDIRTGTLVKGVLRMVRKSSLEGRRTLYLSAVCLCRLLVQTQVLEQKDLDDEPVGWEGVDDLSNEEIKKCI